jgi:hypothetical protein
LRAAAEHEIVRQLRETPMVLPGSKDAVVEAAKVRDYLLSREHSVGRFKAAFFEALGYTVADWARLQRDLLDLGRIWAGMVMLRRASPAGSAGSMRSVVALRDHRVVVLRW